MAANRYGRIYHSDHHFINLRFPSAAVRQEFADKFEKYHAGHDHDGEPPRFEDTAASAIGNMEANRVHDAHSVSIDGYATYEIEAYHNPDRWNSYDNSRYRPPTCCVPPTISINRTFIDSSELTRHELSEICMDMPDEDFQTLLKSVEENGFKDPVIRMIDEQVLDGWHRYRAAKELNLLRKLRFQQWKEKEEGDPVAFAYAKNQARRHQSQSIRAQIAVRFHERFGFIFGHGGDRKSDESSHHDGDLKTRKEIAKGAGVSTTTLDRARQVEKAGRGDEVMAGESAAKIIEEETVKSLWEQINPAISDWKKARDGVGYASKSMFIKASLRWEGLPANTETDVKVLKILLDLLTTTETNILEELVRKQLDGKSLWETPEELAEKRKLALEAEQRMFNALDEVAPDWDYDDFIAAACDKHSDWEAIEFPDLEYTDIPDVWEARYNELHAEITEPAAWIQEMLDKMAEPTESEEQETEQPKQTAEEREANKDLKRKKQVVKVIWDKRIQASRDWLGTEDNDLTTYTDLDELEKAFAKWEEHAYCADAFQSGMRRTAEQTFNICLEKTLASDVSLEALEAEYKAVSSYALDILTWKKQAWIQQLIDKKKAKAEAAEASHHDDSDRTTSAKAEPEPEAGPDTDKDLEDRKEKLRSDLLNNHWLEHYTWQGLDTAAYIQAYGVDADTLVAIEREISAEHPEPEDMTALYEAFNKRFPKWKAKYADSGYKENDLIQGATAAELFDALRDYRESDRTGPVTAEEIKDVTHLMKSQSYPFARRVRNVLRDKQERVSSDAGASLAGLNLPAFNSFLESLLYHVGPVKHQQTQDEASVAVFDALVDCDLTEREQLSLLLDCAQSIVLEYESLDNEVLCEDDEADRQAMNSDLVTEVS